MKNIKGKAKTAVIVVIALVIAVVAICGAFILGKNSSGKKTAETTAAQTTQETTEKATKKETKKETESETETETKHESPTQDITSELGYQIEVKQTLDHETNKTYKASLKDFGIEEGDKITSFTFVFSSDQNIDSYQGGWGVSVTDDCGSKTDDGWYQSDDFTQTVNAKYAEIKVDVPQDVSEHIDAKGQVLIGFWWSSASSVSLDYIIANDVKTASLPVDGTYDKQVSKQLNFNSDSEKEAKIDLSEILNDGDKIQAVKYNISAGSAFGKFTGAFGISVTDKSPEKTEDGYYQSCDVANITDASNLEMTWIIPDSIKDYVDNEGTLDFGFWYAKTDTCTLDSVTLYISNDKGTFKGNKTDTSTQEATEGGNSTNNAEQGSMKSAKDVVAEIKVGWNLGNTFDSKNDSQSKKTDETSWGNPKTTKAMIDSVKSAGFNAIRIPVTWWNHMDGSYKIDPAWMARVKEVVDWSVSDGLYVIINTHHDEDWIDVNSTAQNDAIKKIWQQIGTEFKDYDYHLIFEGMNELRTIGSANEWQGGTSPERQNVNVYMQTFVDTVRQTGGNNSVRPLIVTTYGQSVNGDAVNELKVPNDKNIIVSIHSYAPYNFAQNAGSSNVKTFGTDADKSEITGNFDMLKQKFVDAGIPVIMDEFGNIDKNNEDQREAHFSFFISEAKKRGIKVFVWDNGVFNKGKPDDSYAIFDRKALKWNDGIVKAIMGAA